MFRIGGSAGTGITSGLDTPRQQDNEGNRAFKPNMFEAAQLSMFDRLLP